MFQSSHAFSQFQVPFVPLLAMAALSLSCFLFYLAPGSITDSQGVLSWYAYRVFMLRSWFRAGMSLQHMLRKYFGYTIFGLHAPLGDPNFVVDWLSTRQDFSIWCLSTLVQLEETFLHKVFHHHIPQIIYESGCVLHILFLWHSVRGTWDKMKIEKHDGTIYIILWRHACFFYLGFPMIEFLFPSGRCHRWGHAWFCKGHSGKIVLQRSNWLMRGGGQAIPRCPDAKPLKHLKPIDVWG